ncbi:MAG: hypothetical protein JF610_13000 [Acidobacteria bacterium]|nr:hypothetical protein [Acidobacteriota bacterium]
MTEALRAALQAVQMHLLNTNQTCRHNTCVIRSVSPLDLRRLQLHDFRDVHRPRAVMGNGVSDSQEMA